MTFTRKTSTSIRTVVTEQPSVDKLVIVLWSAGPEQPALAAAPFVYALAAQCLFYLIAPLGLHLAGSAASLNGLQRLWQNHSTLLVSRLIAGQIAPLILSWMIWRTLLIPHTMAATGLFYIALLGVFVGEILGRQILALTSLPF